MMGPAFDGETEAWVLEVCRMGRIFDESPSEELLAELYLECCD
jgi:hypothetical protein